MSRYNVKIAIDGHVQLPAQLRREMNLRAGEVLHVELQNDTLLIRRPSITLEGIRSRFDKYAEPGSDVVGELKAQQSRTRSEAEICSTRQC